jgi:predicted transcriptional regulator
MTDMLRNEASVGQRSNQLKRARDSRSPEAWAKRRETLRWKAEIRKQDIAILRNRGMVPAAIASQLGISMRTLAKHLRELERDGLIEPIPPYLSSR